MNTLQMMQAFSFVVRSGSFSIAAKQLNTSIGQVSRMISSLETHLQAKLLYRTTRRMALTNIGRRYLARCEQVVSLVDEAERDVCSGRKTKKLTLNVQVGTEIDTDSVINSIVQYRKHHPEVDFNLTISDEQANQEIENQDVSIVHSIDVPPARILLRSLGKTSSILCASPCYLKRKGIPEHLDDLICHDWVGMSGINSVRLFALQKAGGEVITFPKSPVLTVNSSLAMSNALISHLGFGLLPRTLVCKAIRKRQLVRVMPEYQGLNTGIYALGVSPKGLDSRTGQWLEYLQLSLSSSFEPECVKTLHQN